MEMIEPRKFYLVLLLTFVLAGNVTAQSQEYNLKQAQEYAVQHNYQARNAVIDIALAVKKIKETLSSGLPQAEASIGYTNFINIPTQLIPAEFFGGKPGEYMEVQFGTKNNVSAQAQLSQLVYSGSYFVGLKMSKIAQEMTHLQLEQVQQDVRQAIASSYILCLVAEKNRDLMAETITTMESLVKDSRAMQQKGFMQETDVDKLTLLLADLKTNQLNAANQIRNAYSLLKFNMGLTITDEIKLTDNLDILLMATDPDGLLAQTFDANSVIGAKMMEAQSNLSKLQVKLAQTEYQPVVSAFLSQTENAQRNSFSFFNSKEKWFPTTIFGVNVGIPIFSSGKRYYKVQQANLNYEKSLNTKRQVNESIALGALTAKNNFQVSVETFRNKRENFELAKKIYAKDQIRYKSGVASTTDLNQTYNSLLQAQGTYLGSIMDLFTKKFELQKAYNLL
jgi:outer membrane protein TolC